jgi:chromosome partition protein MukB
MLARGKFCSLTLINWNGFFARSFDLDDLVTTLSGGNGAGKSTTMAAFVTALIPDLTLLHFRNTTEAGTTLGARDKGLYGKLRAGICYAVVEVRNSRQQRLLFGVRLQQISGREGKIDLKPFLVQDFPESGLIMELLTEKLQKSQVRVRPLMSVKAQLVDSYAASLKSFNSITDYHAALFDLGVLPKRLVAAADRHKFYRLIEASLYGGISSAITRSLRDYLLPDNSGVRKAFQDMEAALRENRLTLAAIRLTQTDRDLFKHLMLQATHYVAADYMRQVNQRRDRVQQLLAARRRLGDQQQQWADQQQQHALLQQQLAEQAALEASWHDQLQQAQQAYQQAQWAVQQQAKIDRYQTALAAAKEQLQAQQGLVVEANQQLTHSEVRLDELVHEIDSLKSQLADQQQALNQQQIQSIQYQQALQALEQARTCCQQPELQPETARQQQQCVEKALQLATEQLLNLSQQLRLAEASTNQFSQAYQQICQLSEAAEEITPAQAGDRAGELLQQLVDQQRLADTLPMLQQQNAELEQRLLQQQQALRLWQVFCQQQPEPQPQLELPTTAQLTTLLQQQRQQQSALVEQLADTRAQVAASCQAREQLTQQLQQQRARAPAWIAAQQAIQQLSQQAGKPLTDSQEISEQLQLLIRDQQQLLQQRETLRNHQQQLEQQIARLQQPGGLEDSELVTVAEQLGGTLLSEIYDDITLEEAPYFSALYGPARQAIVVPDLRKAQQQLISLGAQVDDLYLIEGDAQAFDDHLFEVSEQQQGVMVQLSSRQCRYSRFPLVPLFGRMAREKRLETLLLQRQVLEDDYVKLSSKIQQEERLQQAFNQFISHHLAIAFDSDPQQAIQQIQQQLHSIEQQHRQHLKCQQQLQQQQSRLQQAGDQLNSLTPLAPLLADGSLVERVATARHSILVAQQAHHWVLQQADPICQLEPLLPILQNPPQQIESLRLAYQEAEQRQRQLQQQCFALADILQRMAHFNYTAPPGGEVDLQNLNEQLRERLTTAEKRRQQARQQQQQWQQQQRQCGEVLAALRSTHDTKQQLLQELQQELAALQIPEGPEGLQRAQQHYEASQQALNDGRQARSQLEKTIARSESDLALLQARLQQQQPEQRQQRQQVIIAKKAWCKVLQLARMHRVESALHQQALGYQSAEELRSRSDKALGVLRQAVADNERLRDALRSSEGANASLKKVQFYLTVYQYLQQRIRQDILRTDDPLVAIEQMEVELARLTEELTARESRLALSSKSVATIIRKTIQREQIRIQLLNQGLQQITFGQVRGVRLVVKVHESHERLLAALADQPVQHQALFNQRQLSFSEALATLYQRLTPQADLGQRSPQTIGEALLDYRHYLDLKVEVLRSSEGWLRAESGTLSTGEAIGTGMAILVMVVQSWEEESARLRGKDNLPCRLLFLDEAARLDGQSINTLCELCERLQMQLLIAAPENIHPEKGTTYKLVRKIFQQREQVQVIGLRGFTQTIEDAKQRAAGG